MTTPSKYGPLYPEEMDARETREKGWQKMTREILGFCAPGSLAPRFRLDRRAEDLPREVAHYLSFWRTHADRYGVLRNASQGQCDESGRIVNLERVMGILREWAILNDPIINPCGLAKFINNGQDLAAVNLSGKHDDMPAAVSLIVERAARG